MDDVTAHCGQILTSLKKLKSRSKISKLIFFRFSIFFVDL